MRTTYSLESFGDDFSLHPINFRQFRCPGTEPRITMAIEEALEKLESRERSVVIRRHGLMGRIPETLADVTRTLHLTPERVRQIQKTRTGQA